MSPYGENGFYGDMGWTGIPAVVTTSQGTVGGAGMASQNISQGVGQVAGGSNTSCALCNNPTAQQWLFILGVLLIAVGWHLHLFSLLEEF